MSIYLPEEPESPRAGLALRDYLNLGTGRTLGALLARYQHEPHAPTRSRGTLQHWARKYHWKERARVFEQSQPGQDDLSQSIQRVEHLKSLYAGLQDYLRQAWPVWLEDLQSGTAVLESRENLRAPRFNTGIIIQMRGILDDLARETGGRTPKSPAVASAGAPPDLSLLSDDELAALERLLQKASPASIHQPNLPGFGV